LLPSSRVPRLRLLLLGALALAVPLEAAAQIFVIPERANKGRVRHFELDWRIADLQPTDRGGGLRLYYYDREERVAEWAAASIAESYRELAREFDYVPDVRFPYILYSAYQEFLETNLFPLQEGVLGVTSPIDLTLTLPYFGDHRMFTRVSKHELTHQFTIQKLRAAHAPIEAFPLWFIEGIAELYALGGMDDEALMLMRDRVLYPDEDYRLHDFFVDRPGDVSWTYKMGQARAVFLEETYGAGTVQRILARAGSQSAPRRPGPRRGVQELLAEVTGDSPRRIDRRFDEWVKENAFAAFLESRAHSAAIELVDEGPERLQSFAASPDGRRIAYFVTDRLTGISHLRVMDTTKPDHVETIASDGEPGVESLHPASGRGFALGADVIVFVALVGGTDVIYRDSLEDGDRDRYDIVEHGIIAAYSPALSPDGRRIAFVGLRADGVRDLYTIDADGAVAQLTDDPWTERDVAWGPDGVVYSSDATSHRHHNLFLAAPGVPPRQLTNEPVDESDPVALPDGRLLFVAWHAGRADVHELVGSEVIRRTAVTTGLFSPQPAGDGDIWVAWHRGGSRRLARVKDEDFLAAEPRPAAPDEMQPEPLAELQLTEVDDYSALSPGNWGLGNVFGILGAGDGIYGQLFAVANDRLKNHLLILNFTAYGNFELTDGVLLYINQRGWTTWGIGALQSIEVQLDRSLSGLEEQFLTFERFYGGMALVRYPFNSFQYAELQIALGSVDKTLRTFERDFLSEEGRLDEWRAVNDGQSFQSRATLKLGHDTIRYNPATGPFLGSSILLELSGISQPLGDDASAGYARLDVARYIPTGEAANVFLRAGAGHSTAGKLRRQFFLSSFDTLRGVPFGDSEFLVGSSFGYATAELQFPITPLTFFPVIEGVIGADFGAAGVDWDAVWEHRVLDGVVGANVVLGGLMLRLHFAKPIDVDAPLPNAGDWVTNLSLTWLYY
jgi:hypothetical protein